MPFFKKSDEHKPGGGYAQKVTPLCPSPSQLGEVVSAPCLISHCTPHVTASRSIRDLFIFGISLEEIRDYVRSGREDRARPSRLAARRMTCQNLERLQNSLGATLPCVPSSSPAAWRWTDLLKDTQLAGGWSRARTILSSPCPFLLDPLGSCCHIQNEQRCDGGKYYPLNGTANSDFYAHFGVSVCHHGGNCKSMETNTDTARWTLGIRLFHRPWQEALNCLILWSLFSVLLQRGR